MDPSDLLLAGTTLAASLGGYFLAGLNEYRRDWRTATRERQNRAEDARLRREEERHRLQLEALLAVQEDVQRVARQCVRAMHFDHMQARQGPLTLLPEGWGDDELAARLSMARNANRILDDEVREAVRDLNDVAVDTMQNFGTLKGLSGDALEVAADARMHPVTSAASRANDAIGSSLRYELAWEPR